MTGQKRDQADQDVAWEVQFGQVVCNTSPEIKEEDDRITTYYPHEARLRNLTYAVDVYVNVRLVKKELEPIEKAKQAGRQQKIIGVLEEKEWQRICLFKCPIMVRSKLCQITQAQLTDQQRVKVAKDCFFDQGGYFVINGGEKVIIA